MVSNILSHLQSASHTCGTIKETVSNAYGRTIRFLDHNTENRIGRTVKKVVKLAAKIIANIALAITYPIRALIAKLTSYKPVKTLDDVLKTLKGEEEFWTSLEVPKIATNNEEKIRDEINRLLEKPLKETGKVYNQQTSNQSSSEIIDLLAVKYNTFEERKTGLDHFLVVLDRLNDAQINIKTDFKIDDNVIGRFKRVINKCLESNQEHLIQTTKTICEIGYQLESSILTFESILEKGINADELLEAIKRVELYKKHKYSALDCERLQYDQLYYLEMVKHQNYIENFDTNSTDRKSKILEIAKACTYIKQTFNAAKRREVDPDWEFNAERFNESIKTYAHAKHSRPSFKFESLKYYQEDPKALKKDLELISDAVLSGYSQEYLEKQNYTPVKIQYDFISSLYQTFDVCEPTWNEDSLRILFELVDASTVENSIANEITRWKEQLIVDYAQNVERKFHWHSLNQIRIERGRELGIPLKTATSDFHRGVASVDADKCVKYVKEYCDDPELLIEKVRGFINSKSPSSRVIYKDYLANYLYTQGYSDTEELAHEIFFDIMTMEITKEGAKAILWDLGYLKE